MNHATNWRIIVAEYMRSSEILCNSERSGCCKPYRQMSHMYLVGVRFFNMPATDDMYYAYDKDTQTYFASLCRTTQNCN